MKSLCRVQFVLARAEALPDPYEDGSYPHVFASHYPSEVITATQMLCFNVLWILILTVWGLIGIHTDKFGFKHVWEIWYDFAFPH